VKRIFVFLALLTAATAGKAQQMDSGALSIGLCELISNPDVYAGKRVEVRGRVTQGFENFTVYDDHCSDRDNAVWLTYGDRKESLDYEQRYAAQPIPRTGFAHNRESERLQGLLQAYRAFAPNGDECGESCSYYKVFATMTGWFITGKRRGKGRGGLGHMGCCYLLVMEQVSDVTGVRTEVPYGGVYTCASDEWHPSKIEFSALSSPSAQPASFRAWGAARMQFFSNIAQHWHDAEVRDGQISLATNEWISPDLLRRYELRTDNQSTTVVRQICAARPDHEPKAITSEVLCKQKFWEAPPSNPKTHVGPISEQGQEAAARRLVAAAPPSLGIPEAPPLMNTCNDGVSSNYETAECAFTTSNGDISLWVQLGRTQKRRESGHYDWSGVPWSAYRIHGSICSE